MKFLHSGKADILKSARGKADKYAVLGAGAAVLLIVLGIAVGRMSVERELPAPTPAPAVNTPDYVPTPEPETPKPDDLPVGSIDPNTGFPVRAQPDRKIPVEKLTVDWLRADDTVSIDALEQVSALLNNHGLLGYWGQEAKMHIVGHIRGGERDGMEVIAFTAGGMDLGMGQQSYMFLRDQKTGVIVFLAQNFSAPDAPVTSWPVVSTAAAERENKLSNNPYIQLNMPSLAGPVKDVQGRSYNMASNTFMIGTTDSLPEGVREVGRLAAPWDAKLYLDDGGEFVSNHFFARRFDGQVVQFDLLVPFVETAFHSTDEGHFAPAVYDLFWKGTEGMETRNLEKYFPGVPGGCGTAMVVVVTDAKTLASMQQIGRTADGMPLFERGNLSIAERQEIYNRYDFHNYETPDAEDLIDQSVDQFWARHPEFFWKDDFGRMLTFRIASNLAGAECGKPVIYLYPEQTTDIDVTVAPENGFTFTEPAYGNGWSVTAHPDGRLVNKADGQEYPYLFWEGRGGAYEAPHDFWVVAQADVPAFLNRTLKRVGLNDKETADFIEFWAPRMAAAPWYKIGFHGTNVMDALAPMTTSLAPQSRLRILMDYDELQAPVAEHPPRLGAPFVRKGFTVVEWGGVIE